MKLKYLLIVLLLPTIQAFGQKVLDVRPLSIGDTVPDISLGTMTNYHKTSVRTSDFRGKLLILDFWATYCAPCISIIPAMDSLQEVYKKNIQIISVTDQSEKTVKDFFLMHKNLNKWPSLPCVVNDKILGKWFPNKFIPHYVWIDGSGVIKAFTSDHDLTSENIKSVLDNGHLFRFIPKNDIDVDKPLFSGIYFPLNGMINYKVFIKGHLEGTGAGTHPRQSKTLVGMAWTNIELGGMYMRCGAKMIDNFSPKNVLLNVRDSSDLLESLVKTNRTKWFWDHEYSIDVIVPIAEKDSLYSIMLKEINSNNKYFGSIESIKTKVLELKVIGYPTQLYAGNSTYMNTLSENNDRRLQNAPVSLFVKWLNYHQKNFPQVFDKTGLTRNVNILFSSDAWNLQTIKRDLNKQGLDLIETEKTIDMLVITEKDNDKKGS